MKTYAIGDIHGCYNSLMFALEKIGINNEDRLISCGDVVDRGPRIKETLKFLLERPNTAITLGNHDDSFVQYCLGGKQMKNTFYFMMNQGLSDTLEQLGSDAEEYAARLSKYPHIIRDETNNVIYCHSNYNWKPNENFDIMIHPWDRFAHNQEDFEYNFANYEGPIIVHGHTPVHTNSPKIYEKIGDKLIGINLDGGCYQGYAVQNVCLRILKLPEFEITEYPCLDY